MASRPDQLRGMTAEQARAVVEANDGRADTPTRNRA